MKRTRVILGLVASLGFGAAVACGSSSSGNNGAGSEDSGTNGSSSGASSGGSSGSGSSSGGSACPSGQSQCIGILGTTCMDAGATCVGTTVAANECSATSACPSGQVCCSSYVSSDGGVVLYSDAGGAGGGGLGAGLTVAVQCMSQCPSNAASSEVCVLDDDGGSPTACPSGTVCRDLLPSFLATPGIPNTLCLEPAAVYDGGYPFFDGSFYRPDGGTGGEDSGTTPPASDAASE
jgi:hypothetical protein